MSSSFIYIFIYIYYNSYFFILLLSILMKYFYFFQAIPEETRTTKSCPYCEQICDEERILEHVRNCEQNTYECPLCLKILPEKDKQMHESFDCEVLLNIHRDDGCKYYTYISSM